MPGAIVPMPGEGDFLCRTFRLYQRIWRRHVDFTGSAQEGEAYCVVQWAQPGQTPALLAECARFCRMAGARRVLASRLPETPETAPQIRLVRMTCQRARIPATDAALWPLLPEHGGEFLRIYNERMAEVPAALSLREADLPRLVAQGGGYFVHRDGGSFWALGRWKERPSCPWSPAAGAPEGMWRRRSFR